MGLENDLAGVNSDILKQTTLTMQYNEQTTKFSSETVMYKEKKRIAEETQIEQTRLMEEAYGRSTIAQAAKATAEEDRARAENQKASFEHAAQVAVDEQHAAEGRIDTAQRTISEMENAKRASLIMKNHWQQEQVTAESKKESMMAAHVIAE
jgi:predicted HNH restriction endonuclease